MGYQNEPELAVLKASSLALEISSALEKYKYQTHFIPNSALNIRDLLGLGR